MFYSKSTGGFYDTAIHGNNIPADAVEITADEHAALLEGQSAGKLIQAAANGRPVLVDPPKPTAAEVWDRIKARRDAAKAGGVKVGDKWFHSDADSRIQQIGLVMMGANIPANMQWKTMSGAFVTMAPALAEQIVAATAAHDQAAFAVAEQHRIAMEASTDPAAYDYSAGWPAAYGEQL